MASKNLNHYFNLDENEDNHYTFLPILNRKYYDFYKKQLANFWTVEEIDLSKEKSDFENKLNDNERHFVKNILAFFAASDGIVAENLDLNFTQEICFKEIATLLRFQAMMEDIHSETYSLLIETIINNKEEKSKLFNAINEIPCVQKKANWAKKWTNPLDNDLPNRLVAWACVEGIQFSGSFCAIYWLKKKNVMPGLTFSNQLISRDEGDHTITSVELYNDLDKKYKLDEDTVREIVSEALDVEIEFITESIPCAMLGMNSSLMIQYLQYVSDRLLVQLGYSKKWAVENPFDFMENISVEDKTNFFEKRVSEYSKSGVGGTQEDKEFDLDADF
jgi:ribonucleoside-diphosphate reductase beta chain